MNIRKIIYDYVSKHPLCDTEDIAKHINRTKQHTSKVLHQMESRDSLRCPMKVNNCNRWIVGTNDKFNEMAGLRKPTYLKGNPYGGIRNGDIDRKRVATIAVSAQDALALLSAGASKLFVR